MKIHTCDAIVVCCIDFRLQKFIRIWTDKNLINKKFDLVCFAGSTKDIDIVLKQIEISVRLHKIKQAILIHHQECGAYGEKSTKKLHIAELKKAKKILNSKYPDLKVDLYYLFLSGRFESIK